MLGYLLIGAFAFYYLMPKPVTGPSSEPYVIPGDTTDMTDMSAAPVADWTSDVPKKGKIGTYEVPTNSH